MMRLLAIALLLALPAFAQTDGRLMESYLRSGWSGSTFAHDASGRSGVATVSTGVTFVGGGQYYFPGGTSNCIDMAPAMIVCSQTSWTVIAAFVVTNPAAATSYAIFSEGSSSSTAPYLAIAASSNLNFAVRPWAGASQQVDFVTTNTIHGAWQFVSMTRTGTTIRAGLNGVFIASSNNPAMPSIITNINQQSVGVLARTTKILPFRGVVENVQTYTPALSDDEIAALYQQWRATRP